jgi:hypothetical protein
MRPGRILATIVWFGLMTSCSATGAGDTDRIEGVVTELRSQAFVMAEEGRTIVIDMSALGGITMALATGQRIVAIGTMEPTGDRLHAIRLETPSAHPAPPAKR